MIWKPTSGDETVPPSTPILSKIPGADTMRIISSIIMPIARSIMVPIVDSMIMPMVDSMVMPIT